MTIRYDRLQVALQRALDDWYDQILLPLEEHVVVVGLYTSREWSYLSPTFATSQDLQNRVSRHVFSPADWQHHLMGERLFEEVQEELNHGWNDDFSDFEIDEGKFLQVCQACLLHLKALLSGTMERQVFLFVAGESPWELTPSGRLQRMEGVG